MQDKWFIHMRMHSGSWDAGAGSYDTLERAKSAAGLARSRMFPSTWRAINRTTGETWQTTFRPGDARATWRPAPAVATTAQSAPD